VAEWWNVELKDRTPEWAEKITTVPARDIAAVAREFALTKPAVALFERGASAHTNGVYNGMAIHALNALTGNMFAKGGLRGYQMKTAWAKLPIKAEDFMDDYAKAPERKKPRVDGAKSKRYPLAKNMIQEIAINSLKGEPYKLDTVMFYMTGPIFSAPDCSKWEEALRQIFVIDTSPYPGETNRFADLILPEQNRRRLLVLRLVDGVVPIAAVDLPARVAGPVEVDAGGFLHVPLEIGGSVRVDLR